MGDVNKESRAKRSVQRRKYSEDGLADAIIEGRRTYSIDEKLVSAKYDHVLNIELKAKEVTLQRFHNEGFDTPILIRDKTGLGMRIPSQNFTITDVKKLVGSRRIIDVMDCETQQVSSMTMKEFTSYYLLPPPRSRQLNVLSLEFSSTRLSTYVDPPTVVRQIDWINTTWPAYLKQDQTDGTNMLNTMMYPKVQKYCLMSVGGCYTDFHIDMGGTSVWYHILHGQKIFWLIKPTTENLKVYEMWTRSGRQDHEFLGDLVDKCQRIVLDAGMTFFIPSGWIHAVKTPIDSLVFGGNFLHSYSIEMQLTCFNIENFTKVPTRFRYPYFKEIHWFTLSTYASRLTGQDTTVEKYQVQVKTPPTTPNLVDEKPLALPVTPPAENNNQPHMDNIFDKLDSFKQNIMKSELPILKLKRVSIESKSPEKVKPGSTNNSSSYINLTSLELKGLTAILKWIESLPANRLSVPDQIMDHQQLLNNIKDILVTHGEDTASDQCVALQASETNNNNNNNNSTTSHAIHKSSSETKIRKRNRNCSENKKLENKHKAYAITVRRTRCKQCEPCTRLDCMECKHCVDMKKHGGPGVMKQSCISRQCIMPLLPKNTRCNICDGDKSVNKNTLMEYYVPESSSSIMECARCGEMVHPRCFLDTYDHKYPLNRALVNEDVASTWDCARCVTESLSEEELLNYSDEKPSKQLKTSPSSSCCEPDNDDELSIKAEFLDCSQHDSKENVADFINNMAIARKNNIFEVINDSNTSPPSFINGSINGHSFKKHSPNPMTPILVSSRSRKVNAPSRLDL